MSFSYNDYFIPIKSGNHVHRGWTKTTNNEPKGVTWHWTAAPNVSNSRKALRGLTDRKVSAHYCVGNGFSEGVDRYVSLDNRSWHAQKNQKLRWDGRRSIKRTSGINACIGIETAHIGYARDGYPAQPGWGSFVDQTCTHTRIVPPWTDQQYVMMIAVGKQIIQHWPSIPWQFHHGHHDICPTYKYDVVGLDFARLLRGIYDNPDIPDIWTPLWSTKARQRVLIALGYDLGEWQDDGFWGDYSQRALSKFQNDHSEVEIPYWTTFTNQDAYRALNEVGLDLGEVARTPVS